MRAYYPYFYPYLETLPLFFQTVPGPFPLGAMSPSFWSSRKTTRTISGLTPGHALRSSRMVVCAILELPLTPIFTPSWNHYLFCSHVVADICGFMRPRGDYTSRQNGGIFGAISVLRKGISILFPAGAIAPDIAPEAILPVQSEKQNNIIIYSPFLQFLFAGTRKP